MEVLKMEMKFKGIKNACSETKCCGKNGNYGSTEIALNVKTLEVYATWRYSKNSYSKWMNDDIVNLFTTDFPMTMKELEQRITEEYLTMKYYDRI
jgi:hypothetical protein